MKKLVLTILAAIVVPVSAFSLPSDELLNRLQHNGLVNDFAGAIDAADETRISNLVTEVQVKTTAAIAVVTLRSLEGADVAEFAEKLFQKWAIGEKGKDNGVLVLASIDDRKLRIEVGYGLEGALNDAKTGRILDEQVIPAFKEGRHGAGLYNAAATLAALVATESKVTLTNISMTAFSMTNAPAGAAGTTNTGSGSGLLAIGVFVFIAVILVIVAKKYPGKPGSGGGGSSGPTSRPSSGSSSSSGGSGGFGGGRSGGGGASRSW